MYSARLPLLLLAPLVLMGVVSPQGWQCQSPPEPVGPACVDTATVVEFAKASDTSYAFDTGAKGIDARGVRWEDIPGHAVETTGALGGCWSGGTVDGPYPEDAVYECSSEHCPSGGCPDPCLPYHITAALSVDNRGTTTFDGFSMLDYGDGLSVERGYEGTVIARDCYAADLHDDAFEDDYSQTNWVVERCLIDRAFNVFAYDRRSSADESPKAGWRYEIRDSLIRPHRFTNAYKQKAGHGGVFKDDPDVAPAFVFSGNTILLGPVAGSGQVQFPNADTTTECEGNLYLWQGTQGAWEDMLAGGDSSDAGSNGERLAALNARFTSCITTVVKPSAQSAASFRAQRWDPKVAAWKADHPEMETR